MSGPYHLYDAATGLFLGQSFHTNSVDPQVSADFARSNAPPGCGVYEGVVADHASKRIDVATGQLVDYQPPAPSADHEWNASTRRWELSASVQAKAAARSAALTRIAVLEGQCIRALREAALGVAGSVERLAAIDAAITTQRALLGSGASQPSPPIR